MKTLKEIFEGILDKKNAQDVGKNIDDIYPFPEPDQYYKRKNDAGYTWRCPLIFDYDVVMKFCKDKYYYTNDLSEYGVVRVYVYSEKLGKDLVHYISVAISSYSFPLPFPCSKTIVGGTKKSALGVAYEMLKRIRKHPEIIKFLAEDYFAKKGKPGSKVENEKTWDKIMEEYK